jgi:hypothetical protein
MREREPTAWSSRTNAHTPAVLGGDQDKGVAGHTDREHASGRSSRTSRASHAQVHTAEMTSTAKTAIGEGGVAEMAQAQQGGSDDVDEVEDEVEAAWATSEASQTPWQHSATATADLWLKRHAADMVALCVLRVRRLFGAPPLTTRSSTYATNSFVLHLFLPIHFLLPPPFSTQTVVALRRRQHQRWLATTRQHGERGKGGERTNSGNK